MFGALTPEEILYLFVAVYIAAGILQFLYYPAVKRYADQQVFPDKSYPVSIIVPVKGNSPTLKQNLRKL